LFIEFLEILHGTPSIVLSTRHRLLLYGLPSVLAVGSIDYPYPILCKPYARRATHHTYPEWCKNRALRRGGGDRCAGNPGILHGCRDSNQ
jgi:hypothetical protein